MHFSPILKYKNLRLSIAFTLFLALICLNGPAVYAQEHAVEAEKHEVADGKKAAEEKFDISAFILHHIADAHSFHLWGEGESSVGISLPVILWTNNGPVAFMSGAFHHDDQGRHVVEKNGMRFINHHEKIYYASETPNEHGVYAAVGKDHKVSNAMPIDLSITKNVFTLIFSAVVIAILFIRVGNAYKKRTGKAPKGFQSLMEPVILFVRDDIAIPNLGSKYERFMPYLLTVFFFIWFNNVLGMVPFFPGGANLTGNINLTFILALLTFLITIVNGNKYYWKHILLPDVPWWLWPLMVVVEIIGVFTKPIALMIRLFANITAGHILVLALLCLIFVFKSFFIAPVSVVFVVFISLIELLVGFIQAFIFTVLTALFVGQAVEEHGAH
ncbi:MAG: ATP synthase F0 subunit A [Sphingobacteriales bacterium]|nr:MAG: ATP synthase F0 subunit A [Sphingobacteriales bacterium]